MSSLPPLPASQHGMIMTLPPGSVGPDGALRSAESSLPMGTRLGEFEIVELIGEGGFGIVYLATDHLLGRQVALKEYMPSALASRGAHGQVGVKSERHAETFEAGRRSFVNEARLLAQFDHPALVKVFRFWEGNGTAYMVMPFYRGRTLRQALAEMGTPPTQAWLAQMLSPLLDALETLHVAQCYHRDIAPDNILLLDNGQPVLLDFGAARRVIGDITQALTVILKPGFAPVEQYANGPEMKQGPWTDVYALAAVIYYCATLKAPVPSVSRMIKDTLVPFATVAGDRYDAAFCAAVDHGLAVAVEARPQDIGAFRDSLGLPAGQPIPTVFGATAFGPPPAGPGRGVIDSDDLFAGIGRPAADLESTVVDPAALRRGRTGADVFGSGSAASGRSGSAGSQPMGSGAPFGAAAPTGRPPPNPPPAAPWTPDADVQMQRLGATPRPVARPGAVGCRSPRRWWWSRRSRSVSGSGPSRRHRRRSRRRRAARRCRRHRAPRRQRRRQPHRQRHRQPQGRCPRRRPAGRSVPVRPRRFLPLRRCLRCRRRQRHRLRSRFRRWCRCRSRRPDRPPMAAASRRPRTQARTASRSPG